MLNETREPPLPRGARVAAALAIAILFAGIRLLHLVWRPAFFDELFTVWIARFELRAMLASLALDSGPPLYYLIVRAATGGDASVLAARIVSFGAATTLLVVILRSKRLGTAAFPAAMLLSVFAPHVYFSAEGRAYALAGALAGIGCLGLSAWGEEGRKGALALATVCFLAAAASHYYGVFFFALPLAVGLLGRTRRTALEGLTASMTAGVLFVPGLLLAARQPSESIAWIRMVGEAPSALEPLLQLGMIAAYPRAFVTPPPLWVSAIALTVTWLVLVAGMRSAAARRWAVMTLVPVVFAILFTLAGRQVYFPFRFESVIAGPFAILLAVSLGTFKGRALRAAAMAALIALGFVSCYFGVVSALARRPDPRRAAASFIRENVPPEIPIVASGYAYLETVAQRAPEWSPRLQGFPREIEAHPGWSLPFERSEAAEELGMLPPVPFVWIGERGSGEHRALAGSYHLRPLVAGRGVLVVEAVARR
jgi:hypothetical protein